MFYVLLTLIILFIMKKKLVVMLLAGSAVAMSPACKKKDGDVAKTYTCTCTGATGVTPLQNVSEADKTSKQGQPCGGASGTLAKNVGTWSCE
ncbi:hypothetical protein FACS189452_02270 [Bacteroidia bacterium]|nr:hypothetical protein FACS189452_02270 [Bacteroidia bacterium]GHT80972.1 hypothetical protein FACS189467_4230 [Bacteroidia bacterium]